MAIRVCHITSVHPAKDVRIFYKECTSLAKVYEVYLIAPNVSDEVDSGVHIVGVELPKSRIKRVAKLNKVYKKAIEIDANIYHIHDPELMRIGVKLHKKGKIVIFDSHEDVPQQIFTKEYLPSWSKKTLSSLYAFFEQKLLSRYDALISVTPFIVERLKKINANTVMITNYPSISEYDILETKKNDFSDRKAVCFAGGVSKRYMHEKVVSSLEFTNCNYLMAGPAYPSYLEQLRKMKFWKKVDYLGFLGREEIVEMYNKSFAGIVLLDYSPNVGYHQGTLGVLKMFEYMIAGIPVIATDFVLWKSIIEENRCGICINPHDIHAIADAINFYHHHPDVAKEQGERGRRIVLEKYNWSTQEVILLNLYHALLNGQSSTREFINRKDN